MTTEGSTRRAVRRPVWVLVALVACLAAVAYYQTQRLRRTSDAGAEARRLARDAGALGEAPSDVKLTALETERPEPVEANRNPFRFQPKAPPPAPVRPAPALPRPPAQPTESAEGQPGGGGAPVPAPAPPITLKFIGTIDVPGVGKLAALSDGKFVYRGREGDVIEGRYRIVKIGVESIVMEHLDGRGRQTIRLTG